ncbi:MAG: hypothetical protein NWE88_01080 [Candidatus Bathyarchaeota archaeon]|nr:hypothetical protein [Candidatus Bathyarchaeota archaeon]
MTSPALNRRTRRGLNKRLGHPRNVPLKIIEWKTLVVREWEENGVKHNSHKHAFSIGSTGEEAHTHTQNAFALKPGENCTATHTHTLTVNAGTNHTHTFSGTTALTTASDINHTHTISITSQAGTAHTHGFPSPWPADGCAQCAGNEHTHDSTGDNSGESTHTHGLSGATDNGVGILRWHKHAGRGASLQHGGHPRGGNGIRFLAHLAAGERDN